MLQEFSGKEQNTITAVSIIHLKKDLKENLIEKTIVKFKKLSEKKINEYLKYDKILDYAGAYCAQEEARELIEKMDGSFYNVVGLPVCKVGQVLKKKFRVKIDDEKLEKVCKEDKF